MSLPLLKQLSALFELTSDKVLCLSKACAGLDFIGLLIMMASWRPDRLTFKRAATNESVSTAIQTKSSALASPCMSFC